MWTQFILTVSAISGSWRSNDPRPSPDFSPRVARYIWEWPGDEANYWFVCFYLSLQATELGPKAWVLFFLVPSMKIFFLMQLWSAPTYWTLTMVEWWSLQRETTLTNQLQTITVTNHTHSLETVDAHARVMASGLGMNPHVSRRIVLCSVMLHEATLAHKYNLYLGNILKLSVA